MDDVDALAVCSEKVVKAKKFLGNYRSRLLKVLK
jgi:hypothetical protein